MAGRYPKGSVSQHPNFEKAQEAQEVQEAKRSAAREKAAAVAKKLKPRGMSDAEKRIWDRVATELAVEGRLKSLYVDFVQEYCVVKARIDQTRVDLDISEWTYETEGRHGAQLKSRPEVGQYNDDWRKWNSLVGQLGLSPATELRFNESQGDLFSNPFDDV